MCSSRLGGTFFMSKESKNLDILSDAELICLYKDGDETAESILVYRYRGFSFILARAMYESYGAKFYLDVDDLSSIALFSLFVAIDKFDGKKPFYPYWKKVAQHQMMKHINDASSFYKNILLASTDGYLTNGSPIVTAFSSDNSFEKNDLYERVTEYLSRPDTKVSEDELNVFLLYLDGYSIPEMVELTGFNYSKVRRTLNKIRKKLKNFLHY